MSVSKSPQNEGCYLPHHSITREDKTTSKRRTVFDASAKSSNGISLNERCLNGPTIQPELIDTFIRWRLITQSSFSSRYRKNVSSNRIGP